MIDINKPLRMKSGENFRFIFRLKTDSDYCLVGIITDDDGNERIDYWTSEGKYYIGRDSVEDLENVPEYEYKILFKDGDVRPDYRWMDTKDDAGVEYQQCDRLGHLKRVKGNFNSVVFEPI